MYARIKRTSHILWTLNYNEKKLETGKAICLHAENFVKDLEFLTMDDKLFHFQRLASLRERALQNGIHLSLDFHPSEEFSNAKMVELAKEYMQKMGMERQPYLVYRHFDAAHPHVHLISTCIQSNGKRMESDKNNLWIKSWKVTREMENVHSLVMNDRNRSRQEQLQAHDRAQEISYGQSSTIRQISNVLDAVLPGYKYASLPELNAVLRLYNIRAEETKYDPKKHRHRGLVYQILDKQGADIGRFIPSSSFDSKPTLRNLERRFAVNSFERVQNRQPWERRVTTAIDWILLKRTCDLPGLQQALAKERISMVMQKDRKGIVQGMFYVDHETRAVFDGAALGQRYTAEAMQQRCPELATEQKEALRQEEVVKQKQAPRQRWGFY